MNIQQIVIKLVADQLNVDESEVSPDNHLTNDLSADSLDRVELIMIIECWFHISIDDDAAEAMTTVQHLIDGVAERVC